MIFVLQETVMSGASTYRVFITGVEADSFVRAIERVKHSAAKKGVVLTTEHYSAECWQYVIRPKKDEVPFIITQGCMTDEPIRMLGEPAPGS